MERLVHILVVSLTLVACSQSADSRWPWVRARYGLQQSIELDRAYVDVADDSLIRPAYEYYNRWGSRRNKMLASYYMGTVQANAGDDVEASLYFMEAERRADRLKEYHTRGFAQQKLAELYARNYDTDEAQVYNLKAIESYTLSGDSLSADICRIYVAQHYYKRKQLDQSEAIIDSLLQPKNKPGALIKSYSFSLKGDISFKRGEWEKAADYYNKSMGEGIGYNLTIGKVGNYAYIQEKMGFPHRADSLMEVARGRIATAIDSCIYYSCAKDLFILRQDYHNAYEALSAESSYQNKSVSYLLARSTTHAQKSFFEEHYHLEQQRNTSMAFGIIMAFLSLAIVSMLLIWALRKRKREIELQRDMLFSLKKDLRLLQEEQKSAGVVVDSLLQDRINKIQQLSGKYFYWTDEAMSLRQVQQVSAMTKEVIDEFRKELCDLHDDPYFFSTVETALDVSQNHLMKRLRSTIRGTSDIQFNEDDFRMLSLFFASFSSKSISFILDMKDDAVRKRKSRYKKLFMDQGEAFREFLEHLS